MLPPTPWYSLPWTHKYTPCTVFQSSITLERRGCPHQMTRYRTAIVGVDIDISNAILLGTALLALL